MKADIHPKYDEINVTCSCGNKFKVGSTLGEDLHIEICNRCHPFYSGEQKIVDTAGRVEKFKQRYEMSAKPKATPKAPAEKKEAPVKVEVVVEKKKEASVKKETAHEAKPVKAPEKAAPAKKKAAAPKAKTTAKKAKKA